MSFIRRWLGSEQTCNSPRWGLRADARGAVFVEFLIAFLPVYVFFLCLIQLAILFSVRLVTEHAAVNAARAAAVVIGDDGARYREEPHKLAEAGTRRQVVRNAALITMAPLILNGTVQNVDVLYPSADHPDGPAQTGPLEFTGMQGGAVTKIRVRVEAEAICQISFANRIACPLLNHFLTPNRLNPLGFLTPTQWVRAEAVYPYQGARYEYHRPTRTP